MIPRGAPAIGWWDLLAAALYTGLPGGHVRTATAVERRWSAAGDALVCLSVRSGFDLLLAELALPPGSEVLVSAVTIPDMLLLLKHHGLVPVPLDIDVGTLEPIMAQAAERITPRTRALLVTHLFGSRVALAPALAFAREHGLLVIEDAAQAWDGLYHGDDGVDCSMFSFGPIKTATALGGALLRVRDRALLERMRRRQQGYPRQRQRAFAGRVGRFALLKALAQPMLYGPFVALCRLAGRDHDRLINSAVRGFAGPALLARLRQQPALPLLRLLHRRLRSVDPAAIRRRATHGWELAQRLGPALCPGLNAPQHSFWVFPIASADPAALVRLLLAHGWDATRKASSLVAAPATADGRGAPRAEELLHRIVYLPLHPGADHARLAALVRAFEERRRHAGRSDASQHTRYRPSAVAAEQRGEPR